MGQGNESNFTVSNFEYSKTKGTVRSQKTKQFNSNSPQDADESSIKIQVCLFAFDIIFLNGEVREWSHYHY